MASASRGPGVRALTIRDVTEAIGAGIRDLRTAPRYGLTLGLMYAAAGWLLVALLWRFGLPYLAYPLAMGFALIGPFAAVGFYAVSDLIERGETLSWGRVIASIRNASRRDLRWMALVTGFALVIWMDIAAFLLFAFIGFSGFNAETIGSLFTTPTGLVFLLIGNLSGALIALFVFSISVVSFPMLYDRDVDFVTAMLTSVNLVIDNPRAMIAWCAIIVVLTGLALLSVFVGLIVVLPIVGHATWHLYKRAIAPTEAAAPSGAAVQPS